MDALAAVIEMKALESVSEFSKYASLEEAYDWTSMTEHLWLNIYDWMSMTERLWLNVYDWMSMTEGLYMNIYD